MVKIIVVHKKTPYTVDVGSDWTVLDLKLLLFKYTKVQPEDQKLLGFAGRLDNGRLFKTMKIKENQKILLIGSESEGTSLRSISFTEDKMRMKPQSNPVAVGGVGRAGVHLTEKFDFISLLPKEVVLLIFKHIASTEISMYVAVGECMMVCKKWNAIGKDQFFWYTQFNRSWSLIYKVNEDWREDWKKVYKKKLDLERMWRVAQPSVHYEDRNLSFWGVIGCMAANSKTWYHTSPHHKKTLALGCGQNVYYCDIGEMAVRRKLKGHKDSVTSVETSESIIVSGDAQGNLLLWDLSRSPETLPWSNVSGELTSSLLNVHNSAVMSIKYDNSTLASASSDGTVKVWDLNKVCLSHTFYITKQRRNNNNNNNNNEPTGINTMALNANEILVGADNGYIKLWDFSSGKEEVKINNQHRVTCIERPLYHLLQDHLPHDGSRNYFYSASSEEAEIKLWDLRFYSEPVESYKGFERGINYFSFDGSKIVAALTNNRVEVYAISRFLNDGDGDTVWTLPSLSASSKDSIIFTSDLLVVANNTQLVVRDFNIR